MAKRRYEIDQCYEVLELKPGASADEVKQAYRDLVKVWHPDRFSHDPRLQRRAQEKLKEINEAYERLRSSRSGFRRRRSGPNGSSRPDSSTPTDPFAGPRRIWRVPVWLPVVAVLAPVLLARLIPIRLIGLLLGIFFIVLFLWINARSIRNPKNR